MIRIAKLVVGLGLLILGIWALAINYFFTISTRATLTAATVVARAPTAGRIQIESQKVNQVFERDQIIGQIVIDWPDDSQLSKIQDARRAQATTLTTEPQRETEGFQRTRSITVRSPSSGRIWQTFVSPDELIDRGRPIVSILDCARLFVIAKLTERNLGRIHIGTTAQFRLNGSSRVYQATVIQIIGRLDRLPDNIVSEIPPTGPSSSVEHTVLLALTDPDGALAKSCEIGQTGEVRFRPTAISGL